MPLKTMNVIKKILMPLYAEDIDKTKKLTKAAKKFTEEMQKQIIDDIGKGSIFEHIIKINKKMEKRLQIKVDLQEELIRKEQSLQDYVNLNQQKESKVEKRITPQDVKNIVKEKMEKIKVLLNGEVHSI